MKSAAIRQTFLDFFAKKGHRVVHSSSLVPENDPTLLFTNAGMNQFKDVFLGFDKRSYTRATTAQKCVRAGGKHNDLENVGYTARHHTFFEMMGNFSFGDYFKKDAILFAWELLTDIFKLPKEKLTVTVYAEDDEAYSIWRDDIGVPENRIIKIGDNKGARYLSDNFWMMGETGPCGPCTEIFYDHGENIFGGPPGSKDEDGDRFIEIWNIVFMQFNRDEEGNLTKLPKPSVDTGMGLERMAAVLQGVHSNYEIDLFQNLIAAAAKITACGDLNHSSLKVLADHSRACAFLIADGVLPLNEGRGFVLRRIIRRAVRHGYKLGVKEPFFYQMLPAVIAEMGEAYPELKEKEKKIHQVIADEESRFFQTLENGMALLENALKPLKQGDFLSGDIAFQLHDTFGFPLDLTQDVCREKNIQVDEAAFDWAMARQKQMARESAKFKMAAGVAYEGAESTFEGYAHLVAHAKILAIYKNNESVESIENGDSAMIVLDKTPFYAESGGQVGDKGVLRAAGGEFVVWDTQKIKAQVFAHVGKVSNGTFKVGDSLFAQINHDVRQAIMRNHSATHLLHCALRHVLGEHVQQKGSLVDSEKTRFDFAHHQALSDEEKTAVENWVNAEILKNTPTICREMPIEEAQKLGAVMLFGEKYGDEVRVVDIGQTRELCGGTHVEKTGDIGLFKITQELGVAAGIRRIEALTGWNALRYVQNQSTWIEQALNILKTPQNEFLNKLDSLQKENKNLQKENAQLKNAQTLSNVDVWIQQAQKIANIDVLSVQLENVSVVHLRESLDKIKNKLPNSVAVLASVENGKITVIAGVSKNLTATMKAGDLVRFVCAQIDGKGGGRADLAQGGGNNVAKLKAALASVVEWVKSKQA